MASAPVAVATQLDSRAWQQCVSSLHRELHRIASLEDCQDAVQDALTDSLRRPELEIENLGGWVLVIARRRLLDRHRAAVGRSRDKRRRRAFVPAEADELPAARIGERELVELLADGAAQDACEALQRLSAEQQRLLTLALERTRYTEVAAILGVSAKAAKARTLRAWGALRDTFIETECDAACATTRGRLMQPRSRGVAGAEERQALLAHLETCAPCRAYEKRLKGLIATSPAPSVPFWQQLWLRLEQLLAGPPGSAAAEAAAAQALGAGQAGGALARIVAGFCATAVAGVCAVLIGGPERPPLPTEPPARATPTVVAARASATPTASPAPAVSATRTPKPRKRARTRKPRGGVTGNMVRDTRSVTTRRPASAPAGATTTSEFAPSGGGSTATTAAAPAPAAGGGEFLP